MFELRPYQQEALAALEKYWSRRRRQSARGDGDRDRQERGHRSPDPRHLASVIRLCGSWSSPTRSSSSSRTSSTCSRCGRTPRSESTARASASANGTRRSSSPGVQSVWRNAATAWTAAPGADRRGSPRAARRRRHVSQPAMPSCARWRPPTACGSPDSRRRRSGSTAAGSTKAKARSSTMSSSTTASARESAKAGCRR